MKNTLIPLDIIWINENLTIVDIQTATPCKKEPCKIYSPADSANYVLEINAKKSKELGFETGTKVEIKNLTTTKN